LGAGNEATAPRKRDPRKLGRLLRFSHVNTETFDHEPADHGPIRGGRRSFGRLGLEPRRAERHGLRLLLGSCRVWRDAAVFRNLAGAGLAGAPFCMRANAG